MLAPTWAGGQPLKGGIPQAYPAWDLWILRMLAKSVSQWEPAKMRRKPGAA